MKSIVPIMLASTVVCTALMPCDIAFSAPASGKKQSAEAKPASVYCKLCGQKYPDAKTLLRNRCPHNDGGKGKHILFEGEAADKYICENCGLIYTSLKDLTRNTCPHGNGAAHVPYRGGIKSEYTCRWCGRKFKNLKDMTRNSCHKRPDGKGNHRPNGN